MLINAREHGEFEYAEFVPAEVAQRALALSTDHTTSQGGSTSERVEGSWDDEGVALLNGFAEERREGVGDAVMHVSSEQIVDPASLGTTVAEVATGSVRSPGEEFLGVEMSERPVETLIVASEVSIGRHGEALHPEQVGHALVCPFVAGAAVREEWRAAPALWRGGFTNASHHDATTGPPHAGRSFRLDEVQTSSTSTIWSETRRRV